MKASCIASFNSVCAIGNYVSLKNHIDIIFEDNSVI